jgi:hypothetical protein
MKKVKKADLYTTSYGTTHMKIKSPWGFPKWAKQNFGRDWINNKQLMQSYSKEQMWACLNLFTK